MNKDEARLTKQELIEELRLKMGLSAREAKLLLNSFIESLSEQLENKGSISISGFGRFETKITPARPGRNPQTGEEFLIPSRMRPVFTLSRSLRDKLKNSSKENEAAEHCKPPSGPSDCD